MKILPFTLLFMMSWGQLSPSAVAQTQTNPRAETGGQTELPYFGKIRWVSGFARAIGGETIDYYSAFPDYAKTALLTRASDGKQAIEWETDPAPSPLPWKYVYFGWVASHSSGTNIDKRNFDLYLNDQKVLTITTLPGNQSPDWSVAAPDSTRLVFHQTKRDAANDSHGLAYLRVPVEKLKPGQPLRIRLIGQAQKSQDWFMTFRFSFREKMDMSASLFVRKDGKQPILFNALHFGNPEKLRVFLNGHQTYSQLLPEGFTAIQVPVKAVQQTDSVFVRVMLGKKEMIARSLILRPVRKMTIYILPHSHFDVGYTDLQPTIEKKQMNNLVKAMEYADRTRDYPDGSRFVWNLEGTYAADLFLHCMDEGQRKKLLEAIQSGSVAINGMYFNTLTGLCRPEELLQLFQYATELGQQCGVKPDAAMISDVPGYTWGTVTAMAQAGIKYFSVAPNEGDRIGTILQQCEDKPFYWVSPSGQERVLVWIPFKGYALSHGIPHLSEKFVTDYLNRLQGIHFPYDISYIRWSGHGDNAVPEIEISDFVRNWNAQYEWPRFIISSTSTAFHAFELQYGSQLPSYKGDWTGYWEDGAGSSALETGENRNSSSRLSQAEALWTLVNPGPFPSDRFHEAWQQVLLYSEHTWGADISVSDPLNPKTLGQWSIKKSYADRARSLSLELLREAAGTAEPGTKGAGQGIQVINTNSWERSGLVLVTPELSAGGDLVKDEAGEPVPSQRLSTGALAFVAKRVPPFAAKKYSILPGKAYSDPLVPPVRVSPFFLDNGLLSIELDETGGAIKSIRNKAIDNNFADSSHGNYLNEYLFLPGDQLADLKKNGPVTVTVREQGPVLATLDIQSTAPGCRQLTRSIRLVNGFDYAELTNTLDKTAAELNPHPGDGSWANTGGKESVHFGYPFHVDGGEIRLNVPLGMMRPEKDQIPGSCKNWLEAGEWADVSNQQQGITWATLDAPLVEIGGITATLLGGQGNPEVWRKIIAPTQTLYSWALNNHWETNYRAFQEGIIPFRYALRPHLVFDAVEATQFATGLSQPLLVTKALDKNLSVPMLQLSNPRIIALALKPSEDGKAWMLTLFNPSGQSEKTKLSWREKVLSSYYSNTGETTLTPAPEELELASLKVVIMRIEKR